MLAAERGDLTCALSHFDEALELWDEANLVRAEHYLEKAETFLALRLLDEADAAVTAAVRDLEGRPGAALLFSEGLVLAAVIASNRGEDERAVELNERAAATFAAQDRPGWWALAEHAAIAARLASGVPSASDHARLVRVEYELTRSGHTSGRVAAALTSARLARISGDVVAAARAYRRCAEFGRNGSALQRIQGWVAATERADMEGDGRRVSSSARAGLRTLDGYRSAFDSVELRAKVASYGEGLAAHGLRWAVARRRPERVWSWLERTRAAALVVSPPTEDGEDTEVALGRLRAATARVAELGPDASGIVEAYRELAQAEHALRAVSWQRSRVHSGGIAKGRDPALGRSPTGATLERIRADLGSTGLVQYGIVDGGVIAVAVTSNGRTFLSLGRFGEVALAAREQAFALRRLGRSRTGASCDAAAAATDAALDRLDGLLTSTGLRTVLADCGELIVVPPSEMIGIPWASMPTFSDRPVTVAPSATAWWVTARCRPPTGSRTIALAGPNLLHAADEAERVAAVHANASALIGVDATSQALSDQAGEIGTVHVAAHGHLRRDSPTFSSFELADGPFTVHDIRRLPSPIQRWILAACDLGSSGSSGSELEGIVAALFSAGAGAVIAAVVEVPDNSTTNLMVALHTRLTSGTSMARALHDARRDLDPTDPSERLAHVAFVCFGAA